MAWGGGLCASCAPGEASCPLCGSTPIELTAFFAGTFFGDLVTRVLSDPIRAVVSRAQLARLKGAHPGEEVVGWRVEGFEDPGRGASRSTAS